MKGKEESQERMLNEIEASQLSDIEFKAMVIRKFNELTENYEKLQGNYNELSENYQNLQGNYEELTANYISIKKDIETINKGQQEMKNTICELKNTVEGIYPVKAG